RLRLAALGWMIVVLGLQAPGVAAERSSTCDATVAPSASFAEPSPSSASQFWYGNEALAVLLNRSGTWQGMGPKHNYRNKLSGGGRAMSARRSSDRSSPYRAGGSMARHHPRLRRGRRMPTTRTLAVGQCS